MKVKTILEFTEIQEFLLIQNKIIMKTIFNLRGPHFDKNSNTFQYKLYVNNILCATSNDSGKLLAHVYFSNLESNRTDFELYTNGELYTCTHYLKDYYEQHKEALMPFWKPVIDLSPAKS